jgi:hypothetical protein
MTITTTFASLSKNGFSSPVAISNLTLNQYLTTFSANGGAIPSGSTAGSMYPGSNGNVYILTNENSSITKLDATGNVIYQGSGAPNSAPYINSNVVTDGNFVAIDNSENLYSVGVTNSNCFILSKQTSSGTLTWQRVLSLGTTKTTNLTSIQVDNGGNPLVLATNLDGGNPNVTNARSTLARYDSSGTLINQRRVLTSTSSPVYLGIDKSANTVIVAGTDYTDPVYTSIYNGVYNANNATSNNLILTQTTTTDRYVAGPIVSDDNFYYQVASRQVSGISKSVFMKIDKTTGAVIYSKQLIVSGQNPTLMGIVLDGAGYLYLSGYAAASFGYAYIGKFNASNGDNIWGKTIRNPSNAIRCFSPPAWKDGYVYIGTRLYLEPPTSTHTYGYWKLKDSGSLPNGTWQTYWTVAAATTTSVTVNSTSTGTTTDSPVTTTFAAGTSTGMGGVGFLTATRTAIP